MTKASSKKNSQKASKMNVSRFDAAARLKRWVGNIPAKYRNMVISTAVIIIPLALLITFNDAINSQCVNSLNIAQNKLQTAGVGRTASIVKDVFNTLFFIIAGTIAVLTYLQAKKSLFTPLKTEIFKLQIKSFEDVLTFFAEDFEGSPKDPFDFQQIFYLNLSRMYDDYVDVFFSKQIQFDEERRKTKYSSFIGAIVTESYMRKNFTLVENHIEEPKNAKPKIDNPAILLDQWKKYEFGMINYTRKFDESIKTVKGFISNPVLPESLKALLKEFESNIHDNLLEVGKTLELLSKEMTQKYPNAEAIKKAEFTWAWNKYNRSKHNLGPTKDKILNHISEYLAVNKILR